MKGFLSIVGESINEREFEEELNSKVKLLLYRCESCVVGVSSI